MELFIISGYAAICIVVFTVLRLPLNRWTVPTASVGGMVLSFALIQVLNYYHPHSDLSRQYLTTRPMTTEESGQPKDIPLAIEERSLVAWFHPSSLLRLKHGSTAEVSFDSIPGKVFSGMVQTVVPVSDENQRWAREAPLAATATDDQPLVPVLIDITDRRYAWYASQVPDRSHAQAAIYGQELQELALVRKTLLRMSAWMNYLTPIS
jgi:hypothetical protein